MAEELLNVVWTGAPLRCSNMTPPPHREASWCLSSVWYFPHFLLWHLQTTALPRRPGWLTISSIFDTLVSQLISHLGERAARCVWILCVYSVCAGGGQRGKEVNWKPFHSSLWFMESQQHNFSGNKLVVLLANVLRRLFCPSDTQGRRRTATDPHKDHKHSRLSSISNLILKRSKLV